MKSHISKTVIITAISILSSVAMTAGAFGALGLADLMPAVIMSVLCPLVIAPPACMYLFHQSAKIARLCEQLDRSNQELGQANRKLAELASHDGLTRLLNRSAYFDAVAPLCDSVGGAMLVIDADHFKIVNDTHGHACGDMVLVTIAAAIAGNLPDRSLAARLGGEEFSVFLPAMRRHEAALVAEGIRRAVEQTEPTTFSGLALKITVSVGLAVAEAGTSPSALYRAADEEVYRAKRSGRNRTCGLDQKQAA